MTALHNIKAVTTQPTWTLPWFHRHYPLSFTVTFDKFLKPPRKPPPKITPPRTKTDQLEFQSKFAQAFAALTNTKFHSLQTSSLTDATDIYTDGACPNQYQVSVGNPAGWGFAMRLSTGWMDFWGPVGQNLSTPVPGSNNTAELQALLEALDYVARHKTHHHIRKINLFTDSQLAYDFLHGLSIPKHHQYLLTQIRILIDHLLPHIQIALIKVKGHAGHEGNERADRLAKAGVTSSSNLGRHSHPVRAPLRETIRMNAPTNFETLSLEEQADYVPRTQGIRKPNGHMSTKTNKPEVLAEHLAQNVWNLRDLPPSTTQRP